MSGIGGTNAARSDILILQADGSERADTVARDPRGTMSRLQPLDFNDAPFRSDHVQPTRPARAHLMSDADDWAACRAQSLRLGEQLALQEEFRMIGAEVAERLRETLSRIERRVGDMPLERLLGELTSVQRELFDEDDERDWW